MPGPIADEVRRVVAAAFAEMRGEPSMMKHRAALKATAERFSISTSTVGRIVAESRSTEPRPPRRHAGPPRKLSKEDIDALVEWVEATPSISMYELQLKLKNDRGVDVHVDTIKRRLHDRGISKRRLARALRESAPPKKSTTRFTDKHRRKPVKKPHRGGYPSDLTDQEWAVLQPLLSSAGKPRSYQLRDIIDALLYQTRTGCAWRYLPNDFPPYSVVLHYHQKWTRSGTWELVHDRLRAMVRKKANRNPEPSAAVLDSQTVKSLGARGDVGYDAAKKTKGRKRHILVDMLGLVLAVVVHSASIQDRDGAGLLVNNELTEAHDRLEKVFADAGYSGSFQKRVNSTLKTNLEIVRRQGDSTRGDWAHEDGPPPTRPSGFEVVPKRWIVERTFGWMTRWRRLARDYEASAQSARARVHVSCVALLLGRLVEP